ncbi:hypothetical protein FACS1894172_07510 [Spirochaetia bacterium]|nr:hypothetical protein FACS1894164_02240 [Spirochaetia bacterium]GHU31872.1 hypothetical protein FACS1894172_07510 [Spirochaetia bacterium]
MKLKNSAQVLFGLILLSSLAVVACKTVPVDKKVPTTITNNSTYDVTVKVNGTWEEKDASGETVKIKNPEQRLAPGESWILSTPVDPYQLRFYGPDGLEFSQIESPTSPVKVSETRTKVDILLVDDDGGYPTDLSREGVYIGIISFADEVKVLTPRPILLNDAGYRAIQDILRRENRSELSYQLATNQGTSLYYAVHTALATLSTYGDEFKKLKSVNIVTFTDGLDNTSTSLGFTPLEDKDFRGGSDIEYRDYDRTQIAARKIGGNDIHAFVLPELGSDIADVSKFNSSVEALGTVVTGQTLKDQFGQVVGNLNFTQTGTLLTIRTPSYPKETQIRITFDVPTEQKDGAAATNSRRYVEGVIGLNNGEYTFTPTSVAGVSVARDSVHGTIVNQTEVVYELREAEGFQATDTSSQWTRANTRDQWQRNSEADQQDESARRVDRYSTVIYLVLDNSTSLGAEGIERVRSEVLQFLSDIKTTYDAGN